MSWEAGTCEVTALSLDGAPLNVVYIADPHLRMENIDHVRGVISEINALHPSVVLIGGDFVFGEEDNLSLQEVWNEIDAPVFAVLGNHDYRAGIKGSGIAGKISWVAETYMRSHNMDASFLYSGGDATYADFLEDELEKNGVSVLRNEYVKLTIDGQDIIIVGVDDIWAGRADPPQIPKTGIYTIYLVHEPAYREEWKADLVLSGHTHGGQFNIAGLQALNSFGFVEISGLSKSGDASLYVSRGIGTSNLDRDYRYCASPEIVIINPGDTLISGYPGLLN